MSDRQTLYGLPLDCFVPERGALAKELRQQGQREQAAAVASLRKPSVAAWAVNQVVRSQARDVKALFDAGDRLQKAQSELLAGRGDAAALRDAVERQRTAVEKLVDRAGGLLSADGHELTQATLERVSETLHAAALDEDARSQVQDGCLERELRHVGLGGGGELAAPATRPPGRAKGKTAGKADQADEKRQERERAERLKAARKAETDARRAADRADRELRAAQARRDDAESKLEEAERALEAAHERAEQTSREHERAKRELDGL